MSEFSYKLPFKNFVANKDLYVEYGRKGFSKKQIDDDLIFTLQNRLWNMTLGEKKELGITDEFLDTYNLFQLLSMGRIKYQYDTRSNNNNPVYNIKVDFDGSGIWANVSPINTETNFKPMHTTQTWKSMTRDKIYQDVVARKYRSYKNMLGLESKQVLDQNPWLDSAFESIWRGLFISGQAKTQVGDRVKKFLNENKFFSAILPELKLSDDKRIDELTQEIQKEAIFVEQMMPNLSSDYDITDQMGMMKIGDQMVYTQNIFFDHTMKNEGGFYSKAYSPTNEWNVIKSKWNPKGVEYLYLSKKNDDGTYANDPTIGYGFSLNDEYAVGLLEDRGYDVDKLLKGEQVLGQAHAIDIAYAILNTKYDELTNYFGENIKGDRNTFLAAALVDLNYVSGFGKNTKSFIGPRMKESFERYFNATTDEERAAALGIYGSYLTSEERKITPFGIDTGATYTDDTPTGYIGYDSQYGFADYQPTILGELYNDGAYSKGHRGRLEGNAKLIEAWHNGQSTMFNLPKGVSSDDLPSLDPDKNITTEEIPDVPTIKGTKY